jgi:hypothetical protein
VTVKLLPDQFAVTWFDLKLSIAKMKPDMMHPVSQGDGEFVSRNDFAIGLAVGSQMMGWGGFPAGLRCQTGQMQGFGTGILQDQLKVHFPGHVSLASLILALSCM